MAKKTGNPSGFKDTLPSEQLFFNRLMEHLSDVVELYGFTPIDTPEIEWFDTLSGHDDSGGKLIYRVFNGYELPEGKVDFEQVMDKALRFDLTVPLARYYGQHAHQLPLPFRRYHWGKVFRGETAQTGKGRYREFYQFDADAVGATGVIADAETASMLVDAMRKLELPTIVKINNRLLLDGLMEVGQINDAKTKTAVLMAIDKLDKLGKEKVLAEVAEVTSSDFAQRVGQYLSVEGSNQEKLDQLEQIFSGSSVAKIGLTNLSEIVSILEKAGYQNEISISPEIVRGLGYYTGVIFETFITGFEKYGSVASGGRYDNLIKDLGGPNQPAVGASFGVSRLLDVLQASGWENQAQTPAKVLILNFAESLQADYFALASQLREKSIPTQVYSDSKKLSNQLKYADQIGVPFAVIIGPDEQQKQTAIIRDLKTRQQHQVARSEVVAALLELF